MKALSSRNIVILFLVIAVAISLSFVSYEFSTNTSKTIEDISVRDTRINAEIQVHDLSNSLSNRLADISNNLKLISHTPAVEANEFERAKVILNTAESVNEELVDFYMWLDSDGRIVWISNMNQTQYEIYKGFDLSYRLYFEIPKGNHQAYYSSVTDSNDRISRLYISQPILGQTSGARDDANSANEMTSEFKGVIVAGIRTDVLGNFLEKQLSPELQSQIALLDNTGIILYSKEAQFVGKNVFGLRFQSFLSSIDASVLHSTNEGFKAALSGDTGTKDLMIRDNRVTFTYEPVIIGGQQFGVLYILAPHKQVADVSALIDQQKNMSLILILAIGAIAAGIIYIIFIWNKRLEKIVEARTLELKVAYEQIKNNEKMQREFINIAAHELRTPIQAVLGVADLMESGPAGKDEREKIEVVKADIGIILRNAKRLERLSSDILQVARIESNSLQLNEEVFDMNEVIESAIEDAKQLRSERKDVKIEVERKISADGSLMIKADKSKITEVLLNLLSNAVTFTERGTVQVTMSTIKQKESEMLLVSVSDTGTGIDPDIYPRLFNKFTTKSDKGTGLGLFISKSIIEAHGGKIWAENNKGGQGATFSFNLPLSPTKV